MGFYSKIIVLPPGGFISSAIHLYPLFVVIPKDDVIPKFSFFGIFARKFSDLKISRDST